MRLLCTTFLDMMRYVKKAMVLMLGCLPGAFHYHFTGPALWSHQSSAAFDLWIFLWFAAIVAFLLALCYAPGVESSAPRSPPTERR